MIIETYPEPIVDYIFQLEGDYDTQDNRILDKNLEEFKAMLKPSDSQLQDLKDEFKGRFS